MAYEVVIGRNDEDKERLGTTGCVLLGKHYVKMGQTSSLSNEVWLDASRSHVVFICGKRGSGKCLTGDTLIPLEDGSVVPIKDIAERTANPQGLDEQLKIRPLEKKGFYERTVRKVLELTLRSGKTVRLTPEHPLLTVRGWVQAQHLTVNDRIATPRKLPHANSEELTESQVKVLAYLIAEGHITESIVRFSNTDDALIADFQRAVAETDENAKVVPYREGDFGVVNKDALYDTSGLVRNAQGQFTSESKIRRLPTKLLQWLTELGVAGKKSGKKRIPPAVFRLKKDLLKLFLNRLFSSDGTIYRKKSGSGHYWQVQYSSKSETLIRQVQHLLLRFGVISHLRKKDVKFGGKTFPNYELTILDADKYVEEIGFYGEKHHKQKRAQKENEHKQKNPNVDTIPQEIWDFYRPENWADVGRAFGYKQPKALRSSINYAPSRQKLQQIAIHDEREDIRLLAESDIYWDHIAAIEEQTGTFQVYDTTIPDHHNFVANDIIVHNSYTMGVLAEGIASLPADVRKNIAVLIIDTMGIYWTMKYPNEQDRELLDEWGLSPDGLDVDVYAPQGKYDALVDEGIPADHPFAINPAELEPSQWSAVFGLEPTSTAGALLEHCVDELRSSGEFTLDELEAAVQDADAGEEARQAATNLVGAAKGWGLFNEDATPIDELVQPGQVSVLDVSMYATQAAGWNVRALVIGLVSQKLFEARMMSRRAEEREALEEELTYQPMSERDQPIIWMIIDEAHEFLPNTGSTPATDALVTLLREGRQPGISLVLASQQPGKIHTDVMTQSDVVLSHRITAKVDTDALSMLTQSYMRDDLDVLLNELPRVKGAAIVLDDNNEKLYSIRVRPRTTWHGGSDPDALAGREEL